MEALLVTASLIAVIILIVYKYLTWHHGVFKKMGLDGPKPNILSGNFPGIYTGKEPQAYEADDIYRKYKNTHRAIGIFLSRKPIILILDPALAQDVLVKNFGKYRGNLAADWIYDRKKDKYAAQSPFLTSDDTWKRKRTEVMGALSQSKLNLAYPIWKACAKKLGKYLEQRTADGSAIIETKHIAFCFTSNILGEFIYGIETNSLTKPDEPNPFLDMSMTFLRRIFLSLDRYFQLIPFPFLRRFTQNPFFPIESDRFFSQLAKDAFKMRENDANNQNRTDFINHMRQLKEKTGITHDEIVGHILTMLLDGYETAATLISHTIFYLAHHPEYQEKLRKEILENLEDDGCMTYQKLCSLPYLEQCVIETVRLIPVVILYSRICTERTELDMGDGQKIPINVGQVVSVPAFSYHHDPNYFPKPYEFNPERFNNAAHVELIKQGIFMPFGSGPRICVGMHLGMLEMKTCLVEIFKNYRVKCCEKTIPLSRPDSSTFIMGIDGKFWLEYERL